MKISPLQNKRIGVLRMAFRDFRELGPGVENQQTQPTYDTSSLIGGSSALSH